MQTYAHDQGMDLKSIKMLSMQVLPPDNVTANSTATQSSGGGGGGLDLATIGKGIGAIPPAAPWHVGLLSEVFV